MSISRSRTIADCTIRHIESTVSKNSTTLATIIIGSISAYFTAIHVKGAITANINCTTTVRRVTTIVLNGSASHSKCTANILTITCIVQIYCSTSTTCITGSADIIVFDNTTVHYKGTATLNINGTTVTGICCIA